MGLYKLKYRTRRIISPLLKIFIRFHPNTITWLSLVFSVGAGFCYYKSSLKWTLFLGIVFILLRIGCNLLDGMVARARNLSSSRGEALQEAIDRFADTFIMLGLIFSPSGNVKLGIFVIAIMLISSYLGILKKAVGGVREFGGMLGKVDRLVLIICASIVQIFYNKSIYGFSVFEILFILFIIGGIITIIQRSLSIKRDII